MGIQELQVFQPGGHQKVAQFLMSVGRAHNYCKPSIAGGSNQASSIHLEVGPCKIRGSWTDMGLCVHLLVQELDLMNQPTWQGLKSGKRGHRGGITEPDDD
jgi:hypothetical protein